MKESNNVKQVKNTAVELSAEEMSMVGGGVSTAEIKQAVKDIGNTVGDRLKEKYGPVILGFRDYLFSLKK